MQPLHQLREQQQRPATPQAVVTLLPQAMQLEMLEQELL
jgi:hypothetical protein